MAVTYDPQITTDLDWVRLKIGDRGINNNAVLDDEEILALLRDERNRWLAAAAAAELILARSGGLIEKQVGELRLRWSNKSAESTYQKYIDYMRSKGVRELAGTTAVFKIL